MQLSQLSPEGIQKSFDEKLINAILRTVSYGDVFDYPMRIHEIHRYLEGLNASLDQVREILESGKFPPRLLTEEDGYFTLPGRKEIIRSRIVRSKVSADLWPKAVQYGTMMWRMPFVRMVAVTGALALDNEDKNDIDYLLVTEPRRLWVCRAQIILLVRWAGIHGDLVCPNYFLSENALIFNRHDLYTAHELTQMVPLLGETIYWRIRALNSWVGDYLPNANGFPRTEFLVNHSVQPNFLGKFAENILRSKPVGWVENWEMKRKIKKFSLQMPSSSETDFSAEYCKGHFGEYGQRTMKAYNQRTQVIYESFNIGV